MATFYIIEYNTDNNHPAYKIRQFTTESAAKKFYSKFKVDFAFPGAASEDIRPTMQNWHKRVLSNIYEKPIDLNIKREMKKRITNRRRMKDYYYNDLQAKVDTIYAKCIRIGD